MKNINFVILNRSKWEDLFEGYIPKIEELAPKIVTNEDIWTVLTYIQLTKRGLEATISSSPVKNKINIVDGITFGSDNFSSPIFCVGCRGDGFYPAFCQKVLHQNQIKFKNQKSIYLPQWAQPGLIKRDKTRKEIKNIGFLGDSKKNLSGSFKSDYFFKGLESRGFNFITRGKRGKIIQWNNYLDLDLILAVRDIPQEHLKLKPVNKLSNSWLAGVPAMIGPEPAVQAVKKSNLDYFEVKKPCDVFKVLDKLKSNPDLYHKMIENGFKRGIEYSDDSVANEWFKALGEINKSFERWENKSTSQKKRSFLKRVIRHRLYKRLHKQKIMALYRKRKASIRS